MPAQLTRDAGLAGGFQPGQDLSLVGDVNGAECRADACDGGLAGFARQVENGDLGAGLGEGLRRGEAQSRRAAGHDGG